MGPRILVEKGVLAVVERRIGQDFQEMRYRPVVSAIVESNRGTFLFVERGAKGTWSFPQGDIKGGEVAMDALLRGIWKEVHIPSDSLTIRKFCHNDRIDISGGAQSGFTSGEDYFHFHVVCESTPPVFIDKRSICGYQWVARSTAPAFILMLWATHTLPKKKCESMYFALKSALIP